MIKKLQKGFTLVELMVALAVGALVVIGAGQLFIVTLNSYNKVEEISRKQEAVVFAAHVLTKSYRQGNKDYKMILGDSDCKIVNKNDKIVIDGLLQDDGKCDYFPPVGQKGRYQVKLVLSGVDGEPKEIIFNVMDRNELF